ncbi:MAG: substrate-binding domain-containing protein [Jatrophihabitans sp.]|uniref:substrate-binding domain-containing protein n=1 Tax=Jatrophihabitans sp. TaxID=1932789 RepID=UPI003F801304
MLVLSKKIGVVAGLVATAATSLALAGSAQADTSARSGDIVVVGSDTAQNAVNFLLDAAPGVTGGYNNDGNLNRALAFDATGDANGRLPYDGTCGTVNSTTGLGTFCDSTTNAQPNSQPQSVILRAGTKPVTRPNGSGSGVAALIADGTSNYQGLPAGSIQMARMSRLPNSTEEGNCATSDPKCGGLHVYRIANDQLQIATRSAASGGTDAPAGLSAQELVGIYQCTTTSWNQLPGNSGGSTNTIHPLIPQSGSGTRNFFLADLQAANGGTAITLGSCVRTVQEHDPTGIYADPSPADAIEPFSSGKIAMINSGYLANAGYTNSAGKNAFASGFLTTLSGTPGDSNAVYNSTRGMYVVIRNVDVAITTPFQPGGTNNWAKTFVAGGATSYFARSAQGPQIAAAGFTQAFKDCGIDPTTC